MRESITLTLFFSQQFHKKHIFPAVSLYLSIIFFDLRHPSLQKWFPTVSAKCSVTYSTFSHMTATHLTFSVDSLFFGFYFLMRFHWIQFFFLTNHSCSVHVLLAGSLFSLIHVFFSIERITRTSHIVDRFVNVRARALAHFDTYIHFLHAILVVNASCVWQKFHFCPLRYNPIKN